jgi:hypothetical protein
MSAVEFYGLMFAMGAASVAALIVLFDPTTWSMK